MYWEKIIAVHFFIYLNVMHAKSFQTNWKWTDYCWRGRKKWTWTFQLSHDRFWILTKFPFNYSVARLARLCTVQCSILILYLSINAYWDATSRSCTDLYKFYACQISWQEQMLHCMLLKRQGNNGSELFYFSHDRDGSHDKMSRRQLDHKTEQHELEPREPIAYSPIW